MFPPAAAKTLAFWWPLLYHWAPDDDTEQTPKNILVISPLVALMGEQANDLIQRGIPAIALTSETPNLEEALKDFGLNKFRVAFVRPEMAIGKSFHQHVLKSEVFQANNIGLVIDELHAVDTEDFRVSYNELATLIKHLPTGVPLMMASATLPPILRNSVVYKLSVSTNYDHLAFSNAKPDIRLSVRILQHKLGSYVDLLPLFLENTAGAADFSQTLIYVNSRKEAEEIQDFLWHHCPEAIPVVPFEFYHRYIAESQKVHIQENIRDGTLQGVPTTDALGVHLANLEAEGEGSNAESDAGEPDDVPEVQAAEGEQMDREAAVEVADEDDDGLFLLSFPPIHEEQDVHVRCVTPNNTNTYTCTDTFTPSNTYSQTGITMMHTLSNTYTRTFTLTNTNTYSNTDTYPLRLAHTHPSCPSAAMCRAPHTHPSAPSATSVHPPSFFVFSRRY
ncbi:hypothetical protein B0H14DRAFT_3466041 [Mycena olivaceomarginata]|nr:hypothetical protein B0H14DRAFT_3466041 [Mycena olivaceomarginata]